MTFAKVKRVLGKPSRVDGRWRFGFSTYVAYSWGRSLNWQLGFSQGRVVLIKTPLRARTVSGVGVGSTQRALAAELGARCRHYVPPPGFYERAGKALEGWCYLPPRGKPTTSFNLIADCAFDTGRYVLCPPNKRTYIAREVELVSKVGLQLFRQRPVTEIR